MCGICNLFRCGRRSNDCGCNSYEAEPVCVRRTEPRTKVHCASGLGTASAVPCGCRERSGCDCGCERRHEDDCDNYYENPYCD